MKDFFNKLVRSGNVDRAVSSGHGNQEDQLKRQVAALYGLYTGVLGAEKVVLKAGKLGALELMRSNSLPERVLALQKLVFEDPTIDKLPSVGEIPELLSEIEDELADLCARRTVEDRIEKKIAEKMEERHQEYVQEIRTQVIKEEAPPNAENPQTLKKYALLEKLETRKLTRSAMELLRPATLDEIIGQERAVEALKAKHSS